MEHINKVSSKELIRIMENDNKPVVIDVRESEEVANGVIEGAKHIPLQSIPDVIEELDKSKHYVLVCRSGARSMKAASFLDEHGYKVSNLAGGMLEWEGEVIA
ncbi:rhodanese-like domain-containing protein [Virgibacillus sp. C22-A2]|uniref:Rhodanese-like domain-containing protein n=1 Tax=Virgibacillus tibetensis TaxID=3042313 RepID=A0ABU6KJ12_9BACI|nr:rhodanese-like domain-containing protein [Virgibacillus sp. C22-A2]